MHLLVSELYIYQNARCSDKNDEVRVFLYIYIICLSVNIWSLGDHNFLNLHRQSPSISSVYVFRYCVAIFVNILYITFSTEIPFIVSVTE